ncbi:MAG: MBL fold metallo-hydrolase [Atribacterota bacterium]
MVSKQLRASGGLWIHYRGTSLHLDPGPGALVRALTSRPPCDPTTLQAILLSHRHIDHANDLNIMVEAMTQGGTRKRGIVFLPADALEGEPVLFSYLRDSLDGVHLLQEGCRYDVGSITFETPLRHVHPVETYGFRFLFEEGRVSLIVDTLFEEKLFDAYQGSQILIIHTVRLKKEKSPQLFHLSAEDTQVLIETIRPELAILTHFGMTMLQAKPWKVAEELTQKTGIKVLAASDGMNLPLDPKTGREQGKNG